MNLYKPLTFTGKNVIVTSRPQYSQYKTSDEEISLAMLVHHFDRCYVDRIVKIVEGRLRFVLSDKELDSPDIQPWFLIRGFKDNVIVRDQANAPLKKNGSHETIHLIVNEEYEFYPIVAPVLQIGMKHYSIYNDSHIDEFYGYSETDRLMVEAAIQAFLARNPWGVSDIPEPEWDVF